LKPHELTGHQRTLARRVYQDPWVAEATWELRPFESLAALHGALRQQVERAAPERQLALLRAHPDLGNRVRMSAASTREQAAAGLDQIAQAERESLLALNGEYRTRFGFPVIFAVRGSSHRNTIEELRRRIGGAQEGEFREALEQVYRIAWFRLEDIELEAFAERK
jgi:2-oxo-4-hydroxy-4-carboxy-5-ureidoimidazoline decarboxylase